MRKAHFRKFSDLERKISIVRNVIRNLDNGMCKTAAIEEVATRFRQPISTCFRYYSLYSDELMNEPLNLASDSLVFGKVLKTVKVKGSKSKQLMLNFNAIPADYTANLKITLKANDPQEAKAKLEKVVTKYNFFGHLLNKEDWTQSGNSLSKEVSIG